ncbi:hypothetical protein [Paradesulfitobacterium ferrireducens]|uniref:hypothetical protein n=1 Tax=Paradesulfitobacterium ferrireducens TaxID=2816476 RepID=UPI001F20346C|nr:hypothetical protein [Paradesulfitobacterium ferrireducens]
MKKFLLLLLTLLILLTPVTALGAPKNDNGGSIVQPLSYQYLAGGYSQLIEMGMAPLLSQDTPLPTVR